MRFLWAHRGIACPGRPSFPEDLRAARVMKDQIGRHLAEQAELGHFGSMFLGLKIAVKKHWEKELRTDFARADMAVHYPNHPKGCLGELKSSEIHHRNHLNTSSKHPLQALAETE